MKKIVLVMLLMAMVLTACGDTGKSEPVTKEYTYSDDSSEAEGLAYHEKWTIEGLDDVLYKTSVVYTYTFDDLDAWKESIEETKASLDSEIKELQGPFGSPYITIEYKMDGNSLIATEITDYKTASDDGKNVDGGIDSGLMTSEEYYSVEKVCEQLENAGYTLVD